MDIRKINNFFKDCKNRKDFEIQSPVSSLKVHNTGIKNNDAISSATKDDKENEKTLIEEDLRMKPKYDISFFTENRVSKRCLEQSSKYMVITIALPDQLFQDIELDFEKSSLVLSTPEFFLNLTLCCLVDNTRAKAKWVTDISSLEIIVPCVTRII